MCVYVCVLCVCVVCVCGGGCWYVCGVSCALGKTREKDGEKFEGKRDVTKSDTLPTAKKLETCLLMSKSV